MKAKCLQHIQSTWHQTQPVGLNLQRHHHLLVDMQSREQETHDLVISIKAFLVQFCFKIQKVSPEKGEVITIYGLRSGLILSSGNLPQDTN